MIETRRDSSFMSSSRKKKYLSVVSASPINKQTMAKSSPNILPQSLLITPKVYKYAKGPIFSTQSVEYVKTVTSSIRTSARDYGAAYSSKARLIQVSALSRRFGQQRQNKRMDTLIDLLLDPI